MKKVLLAKYNLGLDKAQTIDTTNLVNDLNAGTNDIKSAIAQNAITLLKQGAKDLLPLRVKKIAYLGVGLDTANTFSSRLSKDFGAEVYMFNYKELEGNVTMLAATLKDKYDAVIIGMHNYSRRPAKQFGISTAAYQLINQVHAQMPSVTFVFGNPYAIKDIAASATNLVACYEDDSLTQQTAADLLQGKIAPKGKLPVTVSEDLHFGMGITASVVLPYDTAQSVLPPASAAQIDSIANDAIAKHATPGCVVLVAKDGKVAFDRSYGYTTYDSLQKVNTDMLYDLASVTKISATTISIMKLYEQGRFDINKTIGDYLPWVKGSNKEHILVRDILLHQAGLVAFIPFYTETLDKAGNPLPSIYRPSKSDSFSIRVAEKLYMRTDWRDTIYSRILKSPVANAGKYLYSDNDFIFLGKIVEAISGMPLEDYVQATFYKPLGMTSTTFRPRERFPLDIIAPTEDEKVFRKQLIRGDVHDPGAAMFGGVAGHAGLFSNAYDLAQLYQMLLNGGEMNGKRYLKAETIAMFTTYSSAVSRRGLGFDKPEKDNDTRKDPYPTISASPLTFGHTGFTGTCVWADPAYNLLYIFLSNRVTPDGGENNKLGKMNVRSNIQEVIYQAVMDTAKGQVVIPHPGPPLTSWRRVKTGT